MELVTKRDVERMNFNMERREMNSVADYMRLYLKILQWAFEYNFITAEQRNGMAGLIWTAIQKAASGKDMIVSNYVYVISMRFATLGNYECWELMKNITCQKDADDFVSGTKEWFVERMKNNLKKGNKGFRRARNLRNARLIATWEKFYKFMKAISGALRCESECNLKSKHDECLFVAMYKTKRAEKGTSLLDKIEDYLQMLYIETSILVKMDAANVMKAVSQERRDDIENEFIPELEDAQYDYDQAVAELERLDAVYAEKLKKASANEYDYEQILVQFEENHPELSEDEIEEAFEEYWESYMDGFSDNYQDVEDEYRFKRARQKEKVDICKRNLDIVNDKIAKFQIIMSQSSDEVSLEDILKEYAIAFLAKEGRIMYPTTSSDKKMMLYRISGEMAAKIFLYNADKLSLTAEEREYLVN